MNGKQSLSKKLQFKKDYGGALENREKSVPYYQLLQDIRDSLFERYQMKELVVHSVVFIWLLVFVSSQLNIARLYDTEHAIEDLLLKTPFMSSTSLDFIRFEGIKRKADFEQFVVNVITPLVLDPAKFLPTNYTTIKSANTLLWGVRFRSVEVVPGMDCSWRARDGLSTADVELIDYVCIPSFSRRVENKKRDCFVWQDESVTGELPYSSAFSTYPGSGFVKDILLSDFNRSIADEETERLQNEMYNLVCRGSTKDGSCLIRRNTAAVVISATFYTPNTNTITFARLLLELFPSGLVSASSSIKSAPYLTFSGSGDQGTQVIGIVMVLLALLRLGFVGLNLWKTQALQRPSRISTSDILRALSELLMVGLLVVLLLDVFVRILLQEKNIGIEDAILSNSNSIYMGAGSMVEWFSAIQWVYSFLIMFYALYFFKYLRLFHGLRTLWCVSIVALPDLVVFFFIVFAALVCLGIFMVIVFGPFSVAYSTVSQSILAVLLQAVGYFSVGNLNFAAPAELVPMAAAYLVIFVLVFNMLLLNLYLAIMLKAFGIVYNEKLRKDNSVQPELRHVDGGVSPLSEFQNWLSIRKSLCGRCCSADGGCIKATTSVLCCIRYDRESWLSLAEVYDRLQSWKKRGKNQEKNFLDFQTLRSALEGDKKSFKQVNNYQVDELFSLCSTKIPTAQAEHIQKFVNSRKGSSLFEYMRDVKQDYEGELSNTENETTRQNPVLFDFQEMFDQFMNLKTNHIKATIDMDQTLDKVKANQAQTLAMLQTMQQILDDLNGFNPSIRVK